jgi:hypothetical protein
MFSPALDLSLLRALFRLAKKQRSAPLSVLGHELACSPDDALARARRLAQAGLLHVTPHRVQLTLSGLAVVVAASPPARARAPQARRASKIACVTVSAGAPLRSSLRTPSPKAA